MCRAASGDLVIRSSTLLILLFGSLTLTSGCAELQRLLSTLLEETSLTSADLDGEWAFRQTSQSCGDPNTDFDAIAADPNVDDPNAVSALLFRLIIVDGVGVTVRYGNATSEFDVPANAEPIRIGDLLPPGTTDDFGFNDFDIRVLTQIERRGATARIRVEREITDPDSEDVWSTVVQFDAEFTSADSLGGSLTFEDLLTVGSCTGRFEASRR